jgi:hypothetical protein
MGYPVYLPTIGNRLAEEIDTELSKARNGHAPQNSAHEGYAVLLEEVDELWDEVKKNGRIRDAAKMRKEAIQVAAMAIRFIQDVIDEPARRKAVRRGGRHIDDDLGVTHERGRGSPQEGA